MGRMLMHYSRYWEKKKLLDKTLCTPLVLQDVRQDKDSRSGGTILKNPRPELV